ncbi:MAG TPA: hypothetical protein VFL59_13495 [Candidatus Nanopelagicales bacterium]|nr:hypothetical protein [Candidatus Nanopelagicales bacterium]
MTTTRTGLSRLQTAGLITAGVLAGAVVAGGVANAATTTPTPATSSSTSSGTTADSTSTFDPGGATPVRSDETAVSSSVAAKLEAAALAKVPGATVIRAETDAGDAAYEVHLTKSDGTLVTVKFDESYAVTAVEDGMGAGDPAPTVTNGTPPSGAPSAPANAPTGSSSTTTG